MQRIYTFLSVFILSLIPLLSFSQNSQHQCGTDAINEAHFKENPEALHKLNQFNSEWSQLLKDIQNNVQLESMIVDDSTYIIPLVFHIIHPNSPLGSQFNPTDEKIQQVVDYLNETFSATWPSYPNASNGGAAINIQFTLAKRDPDCNPTTGINRINAMEELSPSQANTYQTHGVRSNTNSGLNDVTVKNLSRWSNKDYYNIWVVNKIDGWSGYVSGSGVVGYAYFPGANANVDGTIIMEAFNKPGSMTLPHEIGHGLALYHTFQGGCADPADCADSGDYLCDTDPHSQVNGCPTGINPCTGVSWQPVVHNIMNYGTCQNRFTEQQGERMRLALEILRPELLTSLGGVEPGEEDAPQVPVQTNCLPNVPTNNSFRIGASSLYIEDFAYTSPNHPQPASSFYIDHSTSNSCVAAPKPPIELERGKNYELYTEHFYTQQNTKIWIDYNNDGELTEDEVFFTSENVSPNTSSSNSVVKYYEANSLVVPNDAVTNTPLRLRIINEPKNLDIPSACGTVQRGRAMDFTVIIRSDDVNIVENQLSNQLLVYPNPFNSQINIESKQGFEGTLKVVNILGQEVHVQDHLRIEAGQVFTMDVDQLNLNNNLYHLVLISEDGSIMSKKMIKK